MPPLSFWLRFSAIIALTYQSAADVQPAKAELKELCKQNHVYTIICLTLACSYRGIKTKKRHYPVVI